MNDVDCKAALADLYARKVATYGLLDVKFLFKNVEEGDSDAKCRDVARFNQAIQDGKLEVLDFGDLRWNDPD